MIKLEYIVVVPSELGAGLRGFTDEVTIELKDWTPDYENFRLAQSHFRQAIAEWYDGGRVATKEEFEAEQALTDKQTEGAP